MFPSQLLFLLLPLHLILLLGSKLFLADYFLTPAFAMRFLKRNSLSKMPSSLPNPSSPRFGCLSRNIANWDALSRCLWQGCSTNGRDPKVHGAIKRRTTHGRENGSSQKVCVTVFKLKRDLLVWLNGSVTRSLIMETDCLLPAKTIIIYKDHGTLGISSQEGEVPKKLPWWLTALFYMRRTLEYQQTVQLC